MSHIYVTGHKNPDTDTIASAIGYAELKNLLDEENYYSPARLGEVNAQTQWALEKSGAKSPKRISHIKLRVKDVMSDEVAVARKNDPLHKVGLMMAERNISQVPIVDDDHSLVGLITERNLARMYIRESRETSTFAKSPVSVKSMVEVLQGELLAGGGQKFLRQALGNLNGRGFDGAIYGSRGHSGDRGPSRGAAAGDRAWGRGARYLKRQASRRRGAGDGRERGVSVLLSPMDSYVTSRMIQLAVPCWEVMSEDPLTVNPDSFITDITEQVMEVYYRAAIAVDENNVPIGVVTRTDLLNPEPRKVALVDHARWDRA